MPVLQSEGPLALENMRRFQRGVAERAQATFGLAAVLALRSLGGILMSSKVGQVRWEGDNRRSEDNEPEVVTGLQQMTRRSPPYGFLRP